MSKATSLEIVPAAPAKVPTLKSGNDEKVAATFVELFNDAQNGLRRICAFGVFAWSVKLLDLKHGQFGPWVKATFESKGISYRAVRYHMQLTKSALESVGVKSLKPALAKWQSLPISHCGEFLMLPEAKVPEQVKPLREKLFTLIDGKSAKALFTEFAQADDSEDDDEAPGQKKRGNLKSKGRAPKQPSPEELLEAQRKIAREDIQSVITDLHNIRAKFMVLSESKDDQLLRTTLQSELELNAKAISLWNNKPVDKRDPNKIEELFKA